MSKNSLTTSRSPLGDICEIPDRIISVYSLEKHIWADNHSDEAIRNREAELITIEEFQLDPVRSFLNDIFRNLSAPYNPSNKSNPVGQGYWIQAEFGSGKSHLMSFIGALALGSEKAWQLVKEKEEASGKGRRESLYYFWENGFKQKNEGKGIFVIVKTLVGSGGGTIGLDEPGRPFVEYLLDAAKDQIQKELGKNISLYPTELLVDRFLEYDIDRYSNDLRIFLRDSTYFEDDEFEELAEFITNMQEDRSPEYKRSCGNKLWRFYTEYLRVRPQIPAETEDILRHLVESLMHEGYQGVMFLIDEVSLFMKDRTDDLQIDDEKTLVVLANRLAKVENLPIWTICAAQQAIESRTAGTKNIIADDRLKLVPLLQEANDYFTIVLSRVRKITHPELVVNYFNYYKQGFSWPIYIGEDEFTRFFPFHKTSIEVLRDITYELTTTRSAIHFMHQTLKYGITNNKNELIKLWDFFDAALEYEEDPSGTYAGLVAIKTNRNKDYKIYEICRQYIDDKIKGPLKVYSERATKILQVLFLYYIARRKQQGLTAEEITNEVLIEKNDKAVLNENIEHYEYLASNLKRELRQVTEIRDEEGNSRYLFNPVLQGINPRDEFERIKADVQNNEHLRNEAWENLLSLHDWTVRTRTMTLDLSVGVSSLFHKVAPNNQIEENIYWKNREISGSFLMRDISRYITQDYPFPILETSDTDHDFMVLIGKQPLEPNSITNLLDVRKDPRILLWTPGEIKQEEQDYLINYATYRIMITQWSEKDNDDARTIIDWVSEQLQVEIHRIVKIISDRYGRGRIDAYNHLHNGFSMTGEIHAIIAPIVEKILSSTYESNIIEFPDNTPFNQDDGIKVINGIVTKGEIPKNVVIKRNESAAQNFGKPLMITNNGWKKLDTSGNPFIDAIWDFIDAKIDQPTENLPLETIYKNYMGLHGPNNKHYGLTRQIIQIYLLCLVKQGKIRINLKGRATLSVPFIDYSNIQEINFTASILSSVEEIQKMIKPENWEVLRPYLEVILDEKISLDLDESTITNYRSRLKDHYALEKTNINAIYESMISLYTELNIDNPYLSDIENIKIMYSYTLGDDEINGLLYALKESFGYNAFDDEKAYPKEYEDLKIKYTNYRNMVKFMNFEGDLLVLNNYIKYEFSQIKDLEKINNQRLILIDKISNISKYIDNNLLLRTDLLGDRIKIDGDEGTLYYTIKQYVPIYRSLHETVMNQINTNGDQITALLNSSEWKIIEELQNITALQPKKAIETKHKLTENMRVLFQCTNPSRSSINNKLRNYPEHDCGLSFKNFTDKTNTSDELFRNSKKLYENAIKDTASFLLNASVQEKLKQGINDQDISNILKCTTINEVMQYFIDNYSNIQHIVEKINKYLKEIIVIIVNLKDFEPSTRTIEEKHIKNISEEFNKYIKNHIDEYENKEDYLIIVQLE